MNIQIFVAFLTYFSIIIFFAPKFVISGSKKGTEDFEELDKYQPSLLIDSRSQEEIAKSKEFRIKCNILYKKLYKLIPKSGKLNLSIKRSNVFNDSHLKIMSYTRNTDLRKKLFVTFVGEKGDDDTGGLTKEWFTVLSRQMFGTEYGLFMFNPQNTAEINPESGVYQLDHLSYFEFIGRITAMAVLMRIPLDASLSRSFLKSMLGSRMALEEVKCCDPSFYKSLIWFKDNDVTGTDFTFVEEIDHFGEKVIHNLKKNGANLQVDESNKSNYINLKIDFKYRKIVKEQMNAFINGFQFVFPLKLLNPFTVEELDILLCGIKTINVAEWMKYTQYFNCGPNQKEVKWFWNAVKTFNNAERLKLFHYITGVSRVPEKGYKALDFKINRYAENKDGFPEVHTCTNTIDLPKYSKFSKIQEMLRYMIEGSSSYSAA